MVIRNHQGFVIASLLQKFSQAYAPLEVEVLAAAQALEFAAELGIKHTVLEGDSLMLIQVLKNGCVDLSPCGLLLNHVWYRSKFFTHLNYSYVKREVLQKNGSEAAFLKCSHRAKKRCYSSIWPVATFF